MKKKRMVMLFICTALLLFGVVIYLRPTVVPFPYSEKIMGIYIVHEDILAGKVEQNAYENPGVMFEKVLLPYDAVEGVLYLPQSVGVEGWEGNLSVTIENSGEDFYVCSPEDELWHQKSEAIQGNHRYILWLVGENTYYELKLIITGTPVMAIKSERVEEPEKPTYEEDPDKLYFGSETLYYGSVVILDPDMSGDEYVVTQARVCYHEKGATSSVFPKKSYSIDLLDGKEDSMNVSLLGMREDNSWKLNSLYGDVNRVREITASQIWEKFDAAAAEIPEPGPRMEYIELILDNQYQGVYCLVEPVDRKKMQLGAQDVLYKILGWNMPSDDEIQDSVNRGWRIQQAIRVRYPKEITDYALAWQPVRDYHNLFHRSDEVDYEEGLRAIELDNVIDYSLYIMAIAGSDNNYKNMYLASYYTEEGYVTYQIPWDLDYTFGNVYIYAEFPVRFDPDVSLEYMNDVLIRMYQANPQEVGPLVWEKWETYRSTFLNTGAVQALTEANCSYLTETGAIKREMERWPAANVSTNIDELLEYQESRLDWLDSYFIEWAA